MALTVYELRLVAQFLELSISSKAIKVDVLGLIVPHLCLEVVKKKFMDPSHENTDPQVPDTRDDDDVTQSQNTRELQLQLEMANIKLQQAQTEI